MAPAVVPKKAPKSMSKPIEKPIAKSKKMKKKKNYHGFSIYIYKLLRTVAPKEVQGISRKSMLIMNNFVNDMLEKIAVEASRLVVHGKKNTMGSQEIQSAVKLVLPGELAKHANIEGIKALNLYHTSFSQESMKKS